MKCTDALLKLPKIKWHMPMLRKTVAVITARSPLRAALRKSADALENSEF